MPIAYFFKKKGVIFTELIFLAISFGIEIMQYITARGFFDTLDILCYMVGMNLAYLFFRLTNTGEEFRDIDSKILLRKTVELIGTKGYRVGNVDATVCAERPKLKPHIPAMQVCLAEVMGIDADDVSVKATTTEKLGFTGREEGISAYATVLIES